MIEKLDTAVVDQLLESGELTEAQIDMIGEMYAAGNSTSEIVSAVLEENYHASASCFWCRSAKKDGTAKA